MYEAWNKAFNKQNLAGVDELFAPDYVIHGTGLFPDMDLASLKQQCTAWWTVFPDPADGTGRSVNGRSPLPAVVKQECGVTLPRSWTFCSTRSPIAWPAGEHHVCDGVARCLRPSNEPNVVVGSGALRRDTVAATSAG
jgi:hypothetical protein